MTLLRAQELVVDDRPWEIAFENVKVPVENRIGEEGDGFSHAQHWLNVGRIRHGARAMGVIERCLGRPAAARSWFVPQAKHWVDVENGNILKTMLAQILTGKLSVKQAATVASDNIAQTLNEK